MRQPLLTLHGHLDVAPVDIAARRAARTTALALGALLAAGLLLAATVGLRTTGDAGPVRDVALTAPAAGAAGVRPIQAESGLREYLPGEAAGGSGGRPSALGGLLGYLHGEGPAVATAAHGGAGLLEYLPGEAQAAGAGGGVAPLFGPQP